MRGKGIRAMKIGMIALVGAATFAAAANAGFVGWTAVVHDTGSQYQMDVFAGFSSQTDKLLNVFNMNISVNGSAFIQQAGAATNKWRPNVGVSAMGDADSFVTMGGFDDGGTYICGDTTTADPNFTNYATSNATTIPANAGWFCSDPTNPQVVATAIAPFAVGGYSALGSADATFGVWIAHFTVNKPAGLVDATLSIAGSAAFNTGGSLSDQRTIQFAIPAPGALALLGVAGLASRRRRA